MTSAIPSPVVRVCSQCAGALGSNALWGLCHRCLFAQAEAAAADPPVVGGGSRRFGDYWLGPPLGRGGMGVVYRAVQQSLGRTVALKMILDSAADSPAARRRFIFEAETAARLDHPNIVPIFEMGEHDGHLFIAMRLVEGRTLRDGIRSGEFCVARTASGAVAASPKQRAESVARLLATVARTVQYAHQQGVLHRDLKPGNVLVDDAGTPHLTDFGLAKLFEFEPGVTLVSLGTESGTALGTPSYMSPEQAAGRAVTPASDVYSLGAVLYEMLVGEPPFRSPTVLETLRRVAEEPCSRPSLSNPAVDRDLDTICLKCLEKNPLARYASAGALAGDLERWLRREPVHARPVGPAVRVSRWVRRNRIGTALIASLIVCLGTALALWQLALAAERQSGIDREHAEFTLSEEVERLWRDPACGHVTFDSVQLAKMAGSPLRPLGAGPLRMTLAVVVSANPYGQAAAYAPLLGFLEQRMERRLGRRVLLDLKLYKFTGDGAQAPVVLGDADFQRLGPVRYVQARQNRPGLQLVVREDMHKEGVIYARATSGITNLAQVKGRRVAFAHTNSTISLLSRGWLYRAGVTAGMLSHRTNLGVPEPWLGADPPVGNAPRERTDDADGAVHARVFREVQSGACEVGQGPQRQFERHRHRPPGLVELARFPVVADVYVASERVPPAIVAAVRESLIELGRDGWTWWGLRSDETKLLRRLRADLNGFERVDDAEFNELRMVMSREAVRFEQDPAPPAR